MRARLFIGKQARQIGTALIVSALAASAAVAADPPLRKIEDPHYGDSLFHFYQDRYFSSITTLMVSQHFERVQHHADEAEVLRGGLLLSYGLHREAGDIFAGLIETTTAATVRDRAWYFLAKIRYQRGFLAEAEEAVDRVQNHLPRELEEDRGLLKANLLMARADYAGAAKVLNTMTRSPGAGLYARYNLGVALIRSGDAERGSELLDKLGRAEPLKDEPGRAIAVLDEMGRPRAVAEESDRERRPGALSTEEFQSLRDKANVALGFAALQDNVPEKARVYLERVRLTGAQSNKALLGFGWAADGMKDVKLALAPWSELAERDSSDPAVLEARIALPYAFAELGAYGQALDRYNDAIGAFERENKGLDESIASIRSGQFIAALMTRNPGEEMGWFWTLDQLPDLQHKGNLAPVLAKHEFQEAFKNYRDLQFLAKNLNDWFEKLGIFDDMLVNRRQAYAERLPKILARASDSGLDALQQRSDALAADVAQAETDADGVGLADTRQREQLARLADVRSTLQQAGSDPDVAAKRDRARLVGGALTWQLTQDYPARLWEAKKALVTISDGLAEARHHVAALAQAQRDEPARFEAFAARIKELSPRIQALIPRVATLAAEQQQAVQELAVAELTRQKERLAEYTTQARFAVAQLYDRANVVGQTPGTADHANKP